MRLRNPYFLENLYQDQPYASLLLVAPDCDFRCPGCQNRSVGAAEVVDVPVAELAAEYAANPFVDGITVAGLEVCLSGQDFWDELCLLIARAEIPQVTLYTRFSRSHPVLRALLERIARIGCVESLFVKTGMYVAGRPARTVTLEGRETWSVRLASDNQEFAVIKSSRWHLPRHTVAPGRPLASIPVCEGLRSAG